MSWNSKEEIETTRTV